MRGRRLLILSLCALPLSGSGCGSGSPATGTLPISPSQLPPQASSVLGRDDTVAEPPQNRDRTITVFVAPLPAWAAWETQPITGVITVDDGRNLYFSKSGWLVWADVADGSHSLQTFTFGSDSVSCGYGFAGLPTWRKSVVMTNGQTPELRLEYYCD